MADWREAFDAEIRRAEQARADGNEGMARVCARRAAGHAAGEYLRRCGRADTAPSAHDRLRTVCSLADAPPAALEPARRLLLRVTPEHTLPVDADLIAEARMLRQVLLTE